MASTDLWYALYPIEDLDDTYYYFERYSTRTSPQDGQEVVLTEDYSVPADFWDGTVNRRFSEQPSEPMGSFTSVTMMTKSMLISAIGDLRCPHQWPLVQPGLPLISVQAPA